MQHHIAILIWIASGIALAATAAWEAWADIRYAWRRWRALTITVRTVRRTR